MRRVLATSSRTAAPMYGHRSYIGPAPLHTMNNMAAVRAAVIAERAKREARGEVLPDDRAPFVGCQK